MLDSILADVRDRDRRLIVYRQGESTEIEAALATHGISVTHRPLPPDCPEPFVVIEDDGEFAGTIGLAALDRLLDPPIVLPGGGKATEAYGVLFDALVRTEFRSLNRRQLLAVSRELEDRAFRAGAGTLRVSFQTLSTFETQIDVYRTLAAETELKIHVYGLDDWEAPNIEGITDHAHDDEALGRYWVLAFESGVDGIQSGGLVARQESEEFTGCWTDDPELVSKIASELASV